jgi:hypothetical protein
LLAVAIVSAVGTALSGGAAALMAIVAFRTRRNEPPRDQGPTATSQVVVIVVTSNTVSDDKPQADRLTGSETTQESVALFPAKGAAQQHGKGDYHVVAWPGLAWPGLAWPGHRDHCGSPSEVPGATASCYIRGPLTQTPRPARSDGGSRAEIANQTCCPCS